MSFCHTLVTGSFSALLNHKSKGSLHCICNRGWYWPEPYGGQILILWIAIYLWAHSSPPFQIQQKLLWECLHRAVYTTMPLSAGNKRICVCAGADNPIQFTSSLATVCFQTRPSPSNRANAKAPKGDFFLPISSSFKKMKQRSRCPISYSSLTTHRQQEQFLPRILVLPFVKKLGYTEYARSCARSLTSLLKLVISRKNIHIYICVYICCTVSASTDVWKILLLLSISMWNYLLTNYTQICLLLLAIIYCLGHFYSILFLFYSSSHIFFILEEPTCLFSVY